MLWKHVKWDKRLWEIPSTKTEIAHQIPLSDAALAILQEMKAHGTNDNEPVFPGMNNGDFDRQTIEFALAHGITDKTEAAYRRTTALEKRRRLMSQWAQYCAKPISNTVISFHRV